MSNENVEEIQEVVEDTTEEVTSENEELDEIELLKQEISQKQDAYLRLSAEYDNFRKRSIKERESVYRDAVAFAGESMLSVYDALSLALQGIEDENPHKKGIELTFKQLCDAFEKLNISQIEDSVGTIFDANMHNAVMHIEDENLGENVIAETFQKGFKINDKVIRYSTVKVAN